MIDSVTAVLSLRARAVAVTAATTGSISLSATTTGYARAAGSFITDGFAIGMEVLAAGFGNAANNGRSVITALTATVMTVTKIALSTVSSTDLTATIVAGTANATESAGAGRSIVAGLPILRGFENVAIKPSPLAPYIEEDFVPATTTLVAFPASAGTVEETGLYILKLYGMANTGASGIRKVVDAIKLRYTPGTALTAGSDIVRVRTAPGAWAGELLPLDNGRTVCTLTVPWLVRTANLIAA